MATTKILLRDKVWQIILILIDLYILYGIFFTGYYDYIARWDVLMLALRNVVVILASLLVIFKIIRSLFNIFYK